MRKGTKRIAFDFSGKEVQRLREIGIAIEAVTNAEVIRRSLRFYEYAVQKAAEGFDLEFVKENQRVRIPRDLF